MATVNPYIYFNGNCEEAFNFYQGVFRTEISHMEPYKNVPKENRHIFQESDEKVMHATLPISAETYLMGSDNSEAFKESTGYSHFSLIIHVESKEETDRLFNELSESGEVIVELNLTFWGSYFGICTDKFGITWKISSNPN
ncbi:MAG: VOC family protein [Bacteroidota bacterium]